MLSDPTQPVSLMAILREKTRELHEQTESRVDLPTSLQTNDDYLWLLKRFYGFYVPLEARLAERTADWATLGIRFEERRKAANIAADLQFLGMNTDEIHALPRCGALPTIDSIVGTIGCAYVLEGATLGGQIIARHLESTLGMRQDVGARFFRSYGESTGAMWQQFRRAVDWYAAHLPEKDRPNFDEQAVLTAQETFRSLGAWLDQDRKR